MAKETAKKDKKAVKVKRPTALKRDMQAEKANERNRAFKASVKTAVRKLETSLEGTNKAEQQTNLDQVFSLMDKGAKRGIYKENKASRLKSRLATRTLAK